MDFTFLKIYIFNMLGLQKLDKSRAWFFFFFFFIDFTDTKPKQKKKASWLGSESYKACSKSFFFKKIKRKRIKVSRNRKYCLHFYYIYNILKSCIYKKKKKILLRILKSCIFLSLRCHRYRFGSNEMFTVKSM